MTVATFAQPDYTSNTQTGTTYPVNIDAAIKVLSEMGQDFAPHQAVSPDLTVLIDPGKIIKADGTLVSQAQQTATFVAPTANPRIDRIVIDMLTGAYSIIAGTEAASPVAPAITAGKLPCAQVSLIVGQTQITNANITDERTAFANYDARYASLAGNNTFTGTNTFTNIGRILDRDVIQAEVVNTIAETTVYSFLVPGGTLGSNRSLRLKACGNHLNNSGATRALRVDVKFGGTIIANIGDLSLATSVDWRGVSVDLFLSAANATNAQVSTAQIIIGGVAGSSIFYHGFNSNPSIAIDTTVDQALAITITHEAAAASISFRQNSVLLELV